VENATLMEYAFEGEPYDVFFTPKRKSAGQLILSHHHYQNLVEEQYWW
jgi:hypothetical protein